MWGKMDWEMGYRMQRNDAQRNWVNVDEGWIRRRKVNRLLNPWCSAASAPSVAGPCVQIGEKISTYKMKHTT